MMLKRDKVFEVIKSHLEDEVEKYTARYNKTTKDSSLRVGNRVYLKRREVKEGKRKLASAYTGPFRILNDIGNGHFLFRNLRNLQETKVNSDHLKLVPEPAALFELHKS